MTHTLASTFWTVSDVMFPNGKKHLVYGKTGKLLLIFSVSLDPENDHKIFLFASVIQESIIADLLETGWQDMHHKTPDKFHT